MGTKNSAQRALTDNMLNVPAQNNFTVHGNSKSPLGDCTRCGAIQMADERMVYVTGDPEAIRAYEMRQMAIYDLNTSRREGKAEGIAEGRDQGMAKANMQIARKALAEGASIEFVQKITGLSAETIESL
jgi:predicted transposase/invertase (TIGR01784 family)